MKQNANFTLILVGDPTAGKDTQSKILAKKYGMHVFSSGQALRDWKARDKKIAAVLAKDFDKGKFAPTWVVRQVYLDNFKNATQKGMILNGNPRKLREGALVLRLVKEFGHPSPIAIYLYVPDNIVKKRSMKRALEQGRVDDRSVETRLNARNEHLLKTFAYLEKKVPSVRVSGVGTIEQVNKRIVSAIEKLRKKL